MRNIWQNGPLPIKWDLFPKWSVHWLNCSILLRHWWLQEIREFRAPITATLHIFSLWASVSSLCDWYGAIKVLFIEILRVLSSRSDASQSTLQLIVRKDGGHVVILTLKRKRCHEELTKGRWQCQSYALTLALSLNTSWICCSVIIARRWGSCDVVTFALLLLCQLIVFSTREQVWPNSNFHLLLLINFSDFEYFVGALCIEVGSDKSMTCFFFCEEIAGFTRQFPESNSRD